MPAHFEWKTDPIKQLQIMSNGLRNKAQRIAMNSAASPVKAIVVSETPSDTGALKKSMRIKIKSYHNGTKWVCVVGPKVGLIIKGKKGKRSKEPARYNQLVNKGTKYIRGRHHMLKAKGQAGMIFQQRYFAKLREIIPTLLA